MLPLSVPLLTVAALATLGYLLAARRAIAVSGGDSRTLAALPAQYGLNALLTIVIPALAVLIGGAMAGMITLAANAALAANAQVIEVLRLVGAQDGYIAHAFVRRFTLRALIGCGVGVALGMIGVWLMPTASDDGGFLTGLGFVSWGWLMPLAIPVLGALVAFIATSRAANKRLGDLT